MLSIQPGVVSLSARSDAEFVEVDDRPPAEHVEELDHHVELHPEHVGLSYMNVELRVWSYVELRRG